MLFVGFNGTFNVKSVIKQAKSGLHSARVVSPGPHGGEMVCGYNTSNGSPASECVWATKTTFGVVQFLVGGNTVKYPGASTLALELRQAVEVQGNK
jgi:hypothetical protein